MKNLIFITIFCLITVITTQAQSLRIVEVKDKKDILCLFNSECQFNRIGAGDVFVFPSFLDSPERVILSTLFLKGEKGKPTAGMYGYIYKIAIGRIVKNSYPPCVTSLTVKVGDVVNALDFNGDGKKGDQVFVFSGETDDIGLASAEFKGGNITFNFKSPICAGTPTESAQRTLEFGFLTRDSRIWNASTSNVLRGFYQGPKTTDKRGDFLITIEYEGPKSSSYSIKINR